MNPLATRKIPQITNINSDGMDFQYFYKILAIDHTFSEMLDIRNNLKVN